MVPESGFYGLLDPLARGGPQDDLDVGLPVPPLSSGPLRGNAWNAGRRVACWHSTDDGGVACFGEIYNSRELCKQLRLDADTPLPHVLLAAWQRWSVDCLTRLDGVFVIALHHDGGLSLYRDPSGLRDLYYHTGRNGQIGFASHLHTLLRLPGTQRRLARRSLHEYLRFGDIAAPDTIFQGACALEAGQLLRWTAAGIETPVGPAMAPEPESPADFATAVDMLDVRLQRSVRVRLGDAQVPAAFLSGGIDSSLICALASRTHSNLTAVTVGFDDAAHDETPPAGRIAAQLGLRHEVLRFGNDEMVAGFERLGRHLDQPTADPATAATVLAFDHCRSRFDTVLDGTGADEAVGSMPPRHVRIAAGWASLLPANLRRGLAQALQAVPPLAGYAPLLDFEHPADTMIRWNGFTRPEIEALCGEPVSFEHTQFYRTCARFPRRSHFERYSALLNVMPSERLTQAMLITGATIRYPFFDAQTDRLLRTLPTDWRYLPGQPKRILRALLARYLPPELWDAPKHGFNFPLREFLAADDFALVRGYLDRERWRDAHVLCADRVQHYARQFIAGDRRLTFRVWALVMLGAWLEKHDELL